MHYVKNKLKIPVGRVKRTQASGLVVPNATHAQLVYCLPAAKPTELHPDVLIIRSGRDERT